MIVGSAMLVPSIFDAMTKLRSVETRTVLEESLASDSGGGLGLSLEQATELVRWVLIVGGAAAAALAILGWFVLQGDKKARIAVSVGAFPVLATAPYAGGFLAAVVAAGVAMLWTRPARDWFAGRKPRLPQLPGSPGAGGGPSEPSERPRDHAGSREERSADAGVKVTAPVTSAPPMSGYGSSTPQQGWPAPSQQAQPQAWSHPGQPPYGAHAVGPVAPLRPQSVQNACVLTWVFSGITAGLGLILLLSLVADPTRVSEVVLETAQDRGQELDPGMVKPALWILGIVVVAWSAAASLLAHFVWRRLEWARIALVVCAVLSALVGVFAFPLSLLHLAATAWVVGMLLSPVTRAWFSGSRAQ